MNNNRPSLRTRLLGGAALAAAITCAGPAFAQAKAIDIAPQSLTTALYQLGVQTGEQIIFSPDLASAKMSKGVQSADNVELALNQLLVGTGLTYERTTDAFLIKKAAPNPQSSGAAGAGAEVEALIVTAQKREEDIQDVPIAISAFTQEDLTRSQVAGGPDLMTQVPNMTFTKTNFSSYSIQIRGIGTQAISATVDPAVAVAFNNTPFIRNRFFEQEFYDLERVEVLRGPQGTLYGRNATAGVVNLLSAKPVHRFESKLSADLSNYSSRRFEGMLNIPLVEDAVALRIAGAWTKREGFATNQLTGDQIDGRDLWSTRVSLRFDPSDRIRANLVWEHFEENDDRLRSGKQLCKKDLGPDMIGDLVVPQEGGDTFAVTSYISQGCLPVSLYDEQSFQTPNGFALPFYGPTSNLGNPVITGVDPYLSAFQSRDLRVIESTLTPEYTAKADLFQLKADIDLTSSLTLTSETAYSVDELSSFQDYNRFTTKVGAFDPDQGLGVRPNSIAEDGTFCDPQLGCSNRLLLGDLSTAQSRQFSQEFRVSSDYAGAFNFNLGANFLRYDTEDKYYVFVNSLSLFASQRWGAHGDTPYIPGLTDNRECISAGVANPLELYEIVPCIYMDPNPISNLNDQGRNYFLSKNPYRLVSYALFGEGYYEFLPELRLTAGLRWTVDDKHAPQIPSWLLASNAAGDYPVAHVVDQRWSEPTGRLALDWQPRIDFTDSTLLYASYAHGYKAGGANPPPPVVATYAGFNTDTVIALQSHPKTFRPEFIDAIEVGSKNTLLDGRLIANVNAFYYDYEGYQISQIVNRSAVNLNFDSEVWGVEIEAAWRPVDNLRLGFKGGYQNTRLADGSGAVDMMDRTAGNEDWVLVKPFPTIPSNCILPVYVVTAGDLFNIRPAFYNVSFNGICADAYYSGLDPITGLPYVPNPTEEADFSSNDRVPLRDEYLGYIGFDPHSAPNGGAGISKDLSGNELPNAPHFTATLTADYTLPLPNEWLMTLHSDLYYQSEAWTRVFNTEGYDKLKAYTNVNLAAIFTNEDAGWIVMAYVKNVFDRDSITGAFLNSDDTGLTTNVFLTEPRLYGLRITKNWTGGSALGLAGGDGLKGLPLTVEIGGQVQRSDTHSERLEPDFLGAFAPDINPVAPLDRELDWGDEREIGLDYAIPDSAWRVSLGGRWGRANGEASAIREVFADSGCTVAQFVCDLLNLPILTTIANNYGLASSSARQRHTIVDGRFERDIGMGPSSLASSVGVGMRYAQFENHSVFSMSGVPDWALPDEFAGVSSQHTHHDAALDAARSFKGFGPSLNFQAGHPVLGNEQTGRLALDGEITAAVLFGKQQGRVQAETVSESFVGPPGMHPLGEVPTTPPERITLDRRISESAVVPNLSVSLGLSYKIQSVKVGAGYRADRFFDVIDAGLADAESQDRTIHGPYFKLSVGFGG